MFRHLFRRGRLGRTRWFVAAALTLTAAAGLAITVEIAAYQRKPPPLRSHPPDPRGAGRPSPYPAAYGGRVSVTDGRRSQ